MKNFSRRDNCARHQRSHSVAEEKPPIIEGFLEKRYGEVRTQLAQEGQEEKQLQANIEFFECKKELLFMALFDDFQDNRAFKTVKGDWMVSTQRGRRRLVKAKRFGDVTEFFDLQIAVWDGILEAGKVQLQEKLIKKEAHRQRIKGTDVRSNWRTLGDTWEEIATWKSKKTGRRVFDFLKGKIVLEATTSDDFSTSYLRTNKNKFGFADVVGCKDFFEYSLKERDNFDAVVTNPPWDESFLKVFYKFLLFLNKPFVLILRRRGTRHHLFQKVFREKDYILK